MIVIEKKATINNKELLSWSFSLFILFSMIREAGGVTLSGIFYCFIVIMGCMLITRRRLLFPSKALLVFTGYMLLVSIFNISKWGIDQWIVNYIVGIVMFLTMFRTLGINFGEEDWLLIFKRVSILFLIISYINIFVQIDAIIVYVNHISQMAHPHIFTLTGGGVNIDATWLAILAIPMYKSNKRWVILALCTVYAVIVGSRGGMLLNAFSFVFFIITSAYDAKHKIRIILAFFLAIIAVMVFLQVQMEIFDVILARFATVGSDGGSLGRLNMWRYAPDIIEKYPMGVGMGNVMDAIKTVSPLNYSEDNIHCLPIQLFCELGVIGGCWYCILIIVFVIKEKGNIVRKPFTAMVAAYLMISLLEFSGREAMLYCILGAYFAISQAERQCKWNAGTS